MTTLKITEAADQISFKEYGNKKIVVTNADEELFKIACPRLYMPFGMSCFESEFGGPPKYTLDFALTGHDEEGSFVKKFVDGFRRLEERICDEVASQGVAIFGDVKSPNEVRDMFTSAIRDENAGWAPKLKAKVDVTSDGDVFKTPIYDENEVPLQDCPRRGLYAKHSGRSTLELTSIWFYNGRIGALWKVNQLVVYAPSESKLPEFAFRNI